MNGNGPKRGPTLFEWSMIILGFCTTVTALPSLLSFLVSGNHYSGPWWIILCRVVLQTTVCKYFFFPTFGLLIVRLIWVGYVTLIQLIAHLVVLLSHLMVLYRDSPLTLLEHAVVLAAAIGVTFMIVAICKDGLKYDELKKDTLCLVGIGMWTNAFSLLTGITLGHAKTKGEFAKQMESEKRSRAVLLGAKNKETQKLRDLIALIQTIPNPPRIPTDLLP
jgi:hypothetical protein